MADNEVTAVFNIETEKAAKSLKGIEKATIQSADKMQKAFDGLKTVAVAALGFFAVKGVFDFFEAGIEGAIAQEQAMARLRAQMAATGEDTDEAAKAFNDLASELESTTKFGDDAVLSAAALAKSYGISNDEAAKLTRTAADLASATGDTLEGAVEQLTASYSGNVKAIAKLVPELKGLTKEQLAAGGAVDLLSKRFEGAAQKEIQTYGGAVKQATNAFENFREAFGTFITQNGTVVTAINGIGSLFRNLQAIVEKNEAAFTNFINFGVRALVVSLSVAIGVINSVVSAMGVAAATTADFAAIFLPKKLANQAKEFGDSVIVATADMSAAMDDVNNAVDNFAVTVFEAGEVSKVAAKKPQKEQEKYTRAVTKSAEEVEKLRLSAEKYISGLGLGAASPMERIAKEEAAAFAELEKNIIEFSLTEAQVRQASFDISETFRKKRLESYDKENKELIDKTKTTADEMRAIVEAAAADPIKFSIAKLEIPALNITPDMKQGVAAGVGTLGKMLEGAAGAKALIASGAGAIGDALIPGIGGAVGGIVSKLAEGPEATKAFIKEFIAAVPDIIEAIAESIPVVVEVLVDTLVNEGGAVRIGLAIVRAMFGEAILKNIGKQLGISFGSAFNADTLGFKISSGFLKGAEKVKEVFSKASETLVNTASDAGKKLIGFYVSVFDKLRATFENVGRLLYNSIFSGAIKFGQAFISAVTAGVTQITSLISGLFDSYINFMSEKIIQPLVNGFQSLGDTLSTGIKNFAGLFAGLGQSILTPIKQFFTTGFTDLITKAFDSVTKFFRDNLLGYVDAAFRPIINFFESLFNSFRSLGGKDWSDPNSYNPFARGGVVYASNGFKPRGTDTVPAMLTPGEMVLNKGQQTELFNLANNGGGSGNTALLQQLVDLLSQPQTTAVTAQVNGKAIADIVLQQSRQRARLTA